MDEKHTSIFISIIFKSLIHALVTNLLAERSTMSNLDCQIKTVIGSDGHFAIEICSILSRPEGQGIRILIRIPTPELDPELAPQPSDTYIGPPPPPLSTHPSIFDFRCVEMSVQLAAAASCTSRI